MYIIVYFIIYFFVFLVVLKFIIYDVKVYIKNDNWIVFFVY